jgi:hypothetical protein
MCEKWLIPKSSSANDGCDKDKEILTTMQEEKKKKKKRHTDETSK